MAGASWFEAAADYDTFMRGWSRAAGERFLAWFGAPAGARWVDVGCGTGAFTELVLDSAAPASAVGVDAEASQVEHARALPVGRRAAFQVADAQQLPFANAAFDVAAAALVFNFVENPAAAVAEMRRVVRRGGLVGAYVWDFAGHRAPGAIVRVALQAQGVSLPELPGVATTRLDALQAQFAHAGLHDVETGALDVHLRFPDFDSVLRNLLPRFGPTGAALGRLSPAQHQELERELRRMLPSDADGTIGCGVRAHAVRGRVP